MAAPSPLAGAVRAAEDLRGLDRSGLARVTAATTCLGAGMVALAVAGPLLRGESTPVAPLAAAALVALAAWQLGWALVALGAVRLPSPRAAAVIAAAAAFGWLATAPILSPGAHTARTSALLAVLLSAASCGAGVLSRLWEHSATRAPAPVGVQVAVLLVVAFAVAAVVVPALAGSPAGDGAMPGMGM